MKYFVAMFQLLLGLLFLSSMATGHIEPGVQSAICTVVIVGTVLTFIHVLRANK